MHWIALQAPAEAPALREAQVQGGMADLHTALAWWALRFSPFLARVQTSLVLETSSSERLFGGRAALLHRLLHTGPVTAMHHAQGHTSLEALARLWCMAKSAAPLGLHALPADPQHWQSLALDHLPLHSLQAARDHLPTLQCLGCRTWGDLRALPRGGVARRFGAALLDALDRAYGERPETYPWLTLPEVFDEKLELAAAVDAAPALLFGARRLLAQLLVWLRARQHGVLALELRWQLDARRANAQHHDAHHDGQGWGSLPVRTAQATQDMAHLQRLLAEQLARVQLPAPVLYLQLRTLQTQALSGETHSLLPQDMRSGDSLHQMVERVSARLGRAQVRCVQLQPHHVPEHMQHWQPWTASLWAQLQRPGQAQPLPSAGAHLPTWLLEVPQKLVVQGAQPYYQGLLELLLGPQRLESGWLEGAPVLRDYYVARSPRAGLVWIYQERLRSASCWYLHGFFA